jgi:uncharacterized protein
VAVLVLLAGAGLWLGWQAGRVNWARLLGGDRLFGSREVVIDIRGQRSPAEVEIALARPTPAEPPAPPMVESMLAPPEVPPAPKIEAPAGQVAAMGPAIAVASAVAKNPPAPSKTAPPSREAPAAAPRRQAGAAAEGDAILYPLSLPAWRRNARPFDLNDPRPRIAVVLVGLGPLHGVTAAAIEKLPAEVSLSFDPYDQGLSEWTGLAHALGHEILLDLPADGVPVAEAGGASFAAWRRASADLERLAWVAGRARGYVGLAVASGSALSASPVGRSSVLEAIGRHGLLLLDARPGDPGLGGGAAAGLPRIAADLDIDRRPDSLAIDAQLAALEARARETGFAVGIAKGYPATIERLLAWSRGLQEKNLALAPVSALAAQQSVR